MLFNLLLIFCAYLPFQVALNPSAGVDLASSRVFVLLLFFVWLVEGLRRKKLFIESGKVNFFLASFLFLSLLSIVVSKNSDWSVRKLLFLFSVFPLYFVAADLVSSKEQMIKVVRFLVWGGFLVALLGAAQFAAQFIFGLDATYKFWANYVSPIFLGGNVTAAVLKNPSWLVNISGRTYLRAIATFPDPHMLAFFLGMLLPLALGLFLKLKNKIYLFIFFVLLLTDLLTFSRGGYLGLFAGFAVAIGVLLSRLKKKHQLGALILVVCLGSFLIIPGPISERFLSSFNFQEGSNQGRIETWRKALVVIVDHPLLGVGIGNYPLEISATADYRDPIYAHSNYLDIAAETGIVSLLAWLGFLGTLFFIFLKKSKEVLFFCVAVSVVISSAHSLVETSIYSPVVLSLFLIIAGFSRLANSDEKNS
ncbi:MAG: O-antigen ligase family protein [Candidatus Moranbacteria bacterium]|nr:O-antigen ligase family protein [Candidatus Moranbacteria bacterium]